MPIGSFESAIRSLLKEMEIGTPLLTSTGISGFVTAQSGQQVIFSAKAEKLISSIGLQLKLSRPALSRSHTDNEWSALIRQAFGDAYAGLSNPRNRTQAALQIAGELKVAANAIASQQTQRLFSFGATLMANAHFDALRIGPVCFERREHWLKRSLETGLMSATTARRVAKKWQGTNSRRRKASYDSISERSILDAVGAHPLICTVEVKGLGAELGKRKALIAAQVAEVAVALMWQTPSTALRGFHLLSDSGAEREQVLVTVPPHKPTTSSTLRRFPTGPNLTKKDWERDLPIYQPIFDLIGEAVSYFLEPTPSTSRPRLMNVLVQALFSFFEACNSSFDQIAVARFVSVLDGLAAGTQEQGIRALLMKRARFTEGKPIFKGGPVMKDFVHQIYSDARSRTVHGTSDKFGNDWTDVRTKVEVLCRLMLIRCMSWMIGNAGLDDPSEMRR